MTKTFTLHQPETSIPVIFDSPHSGQRHPKDFNYACQLEDLKNCADHMVDELFADTATLGATFLEAHTSRTYIDLNRSADDIDPMLLSAPWENSEIKPTQRSAAGIGLIRRLIKPGKPIYDRTLTQKEIETRIKKHYIPYHEQLARLLNEAHYNFGQVWHINCHSMPASTAVPRQKSIGFLGNRGKPVDFVLGDRDGTTCDTNFTHAIRDFLQDLGYTVAINDPFKGVTLIGQYASPAIGRHSLQLEINKALYMDEETGKKNKNYKKVKADIDKLIEFIIQHAQSKLTDLAAD